MDLVKGLVDFVLHIDRHLGAFVGEHGVWTYGLLIAIIFLETGLVVTPFLPGDSLLFTAGALSAAYPDKLGIGVLFAVLAAAAIAGDSLNYTIGRSERLRRLMLRMPMVKPQHLHKTEQFYERYGAKMIVLARFVPIVRTFAPFIAGIGKMPYRTFVTYNVVGGLAWVGICLAAGRLFGNIPIVKKNFELVVIGIIVVSVLPLVIEYMRARARAKTENITPASAPGA